MNYLAWLWTLFVVAPLLMLVLYAAGIQYEAGGWMRWWLLPLVLVAAVLDVLLNYTVLAVYTADFPLRGEFTFSQRMPRLIEAGGRVGKVCLLLALALNVLAPGGVHIKLKGSPNGQ